jgi:hypothetical protein
MNELGEMWKEATLAYCKLLYQYLFEVTEKTTKKSKEPVPGSRFEPETYTYEESVNLKFFKGVSLNSYIFWTVSFIY